MCGIGFILGTSPADDVFVGGFLEALRRRGPDESSTKHFELEVRNRTSRERLYNASVKSRVECWIQPYLLPRL